MFPLLLRRPLLFSSSSTLARPSALSFAEKVITNTFMVLCNRRAQSRRVMRKLERTPE